MKRKDQVAAAFSAAASTYETAAQAQDIAAAHLTAIVGGLNRPTTPEVLEIGCGTGLLTRRLRPVVTGRWLVTDLSAAMIEAARRTAPDAEFQVLDAENPALGTRRFDLIVSNLAAQWFADLGATIAGLAAMLKPGGHLAFSTLGLRSFQQWRQVHQVLGLPCGVPVFPSAEAFAALLPAGAHIEEQDFTLDYPHGRAFAAELKLIGAGTPAPGHRPLTVKDMRRVLERLGQPAPMTYHVLHAVITAE